MSINVIVLFSEILHLDVYFGLDKRVKICWMIERINLGKHTSSRT